MNIKRVGLTGLAVFITYFILEMLIHGFALSDIYQQTASIWRSQEEMKQLAALMVIGQAIFAFAFAIIYSYGFEARKSRIKQGLRYGALMALLVAPPTSLGWYVVLPIPALLAFYWFISAVFEMLILGLVAGIVYKR